MICWFCCCFVCLWELDLLIRLIAFFFKFIYTEFNQCTTKFDKVLCDPSCFFFITDGSWGGSWTRWPPEVLNFPIIIKNSRKAVMRSLEPEHPCCSNVTTAGRPCILLWHCNLSEKKENLNDTVADKYTAYCLSSYWHSYLQLCFLMTIYDNCIKFNSRQLPHAMQILFYSNKK